MLLAHKKKLSCLCLLDLSAAFDIVDKLLITRLFGSEFVDMPAIGFSCHLMSSSIKKIINRLFRYASSLESTSYLISNMCVSILLLFYTSIVSAFCAKNKRNFVSVMSISLLMMSYFAIHRLLSHHRLHHPSQYFTPGSTLNVYQPFLSRSSLRSESADIV